MFYQSWNFTLHNSSRYRMYREFKSLLAPEKYLSCIIENKLRNMLIKFRCGLLKLKVNEGRWLNIDVTERNCPICNSGIEDEYHLFLYVLNIAH